ncbi:transporter [Tenacibaculum sp. TC6]|uniref:transporter n=1 Tax=Tenacibaculum sp. TC6 TaxID=3423223 RepID=UPI003D36DDBE
MLTLKKSFVGIAMLFCFPTLITAQTAITGFYPEKNKFTVAVNYVSKSYDKFYMGETLSDGNPANLGEISSSIIGVYADYGINNWLSAVVSFPYVSVKSDEGNLDPVHKQSKQSGLQDLSLFLKARAFERNFTDGSKFSLGGAAGISFPMSDYEGNGILSIGNKATAVDGIAVLQYTTNFNLFIEAQTGFSIRSNADFDIPNALLYSFKLGYYNQWFYAHTKLGIQDSTSGYDIGSAAFGANGGPTALSQTEVDYTNLSFDVYVPVYKQNFGVTAGYGVNLDGRNFGNERGFSVGLVYKN